MGEEQQAISGELIDQGGTVVQPAQPTDSPAAESTPRKKRFTWKWAIALGVIVCCLGIPGTGLFVWLGIPLIRGTIDAGKGSPTPTVALLELFQTFNNDEYSAMDAKRYVIDSREGEVLKVRDDFMREWNSDTGAVAGSKLVIAEPLPGMEPAYERINGDTAQVLDYYGFQYPINPERGGTLTMNSGGMPWKAEARKEDDGWRIWSLDIPSYCGDRGKPGYVRCNN